MSTGADELRAAAEEIRRLAMGAPSNNQPWQYAKGSPSDSVRTATGWEVAYGDAPGDLRYIAAMHPGVGLALADWLEATAAEVARIEEQYQDRTAGEALAPHALAVARQINTGSQP